MSYLKPFFFLMGRASVFWVGSAILLGLSIVMLGLSQPDRPPGPYVNVAFLAAFAFPAAAGWLAGVVIQELEHSTFAWSLPRVRHRVASGFLLTGLAVSVVVAVYAARSASAQNGTLVLIAVGIAAYCLGGVLLDPLQPWLASLSFISVLLFTMRSQYLADISTEHPLWAAAAAGGLGLLGCGRLFARSTFRRKPFSPTAPFPGSFALERSVQYERARWAREAPRGREWKGGYLDADPWSWARASVHESYGPLDWRTLPRVLQRFWVLGLLFAIYAWSDQGDLGYWEALGKTVHEGILDSPHVAPFGELGEGRGPSPIVALVIGAAGAIIGLWSPASFNTTLAYPLGRRLRAAVAFRAALVDAVAFSVAVVTTLSVVGIASAWLAGYEQRFDFVPFFLRALIGTLLLMPLSHWGRLYLGIAIKRRTGDTLVPMILGVVGFVTAVLVWSYLTAGLFAVPAVGVATSILLLAISQAVFLWGLNNFYGNRDLI